MFIANPIGFLLRTGRGRRAVLIVGALLALTPLVAGCTQSADLQAATTTNNNAASAPAIQAQATSETGTPQVSATAPISATDATTETTTVSTAPTSTPPDPMNQLDVFQFFSPQQLIVKRDALQLEGSDTPEMLFTASEVSEAITQETYSALVVASYNTTGHIWNQIWRSDIVTGTASPLPAANRSGGYNGGNLLGTGNPILMLRSNTLEGHAHLYMWNWNTSDRKGERLKMVPANGGPERDSDFEADLDVNVADLDNDGIFEVVADNVAGVQIWKWDGSKYVPEANSK